MLIFTNREVDIAATGSVTFGRQFQPGALTLGSALARRGAAGFETADGHADLSDDDAMQMLVPLFSGQRHRRTAFFPHRSAVIMTTGR